MMISTMLNKFLKNFAILLFWLSVWQLLSMAIANQLLIPSPLSTLSALMKLCKTEEFYFSVLLSLLRIICGFALGVVIGFLCALLSVRLKLFKEVTYPLLQIIKAVPVASFIILAFFWFKSAYLPIFISFLMVLPIIWSATETALRGIDIKYIEMAQVYRLKPLKIFFQIKLPFILPSFISASLTSLGFAWKSGIAAEVICKPASSLGKMLEQSKTHLEISEVFALTAVVAVLSIFLEITLKRLLRRYKNDKY